VQAGQAFHANYSVSYEVITHVRYRDVPFTVLQERYSLIGRKAAELVEYFWGVQDFREIAGAHRNRMPVRSSCAYAPYNSMIAWLSADDRRPSVVQD
jgi:hypothetical protein